MPVASNCSPRVARASVAVISAALGASLAHAQGSVATRPPVSLVVVITVDQMRGDYIARYAAQYTGGFARIASQAALFPRGVQDHANTETAPGHSTILSGREPTHTGIASNDRGVPDPLAPLVDYAGPGASPARFIGTTLVDWLHNADTNSRVLSVSRKDRGAILPVGRAKGSVFWWADGAFTTSRYYADTLPAWVRAFLSTLARVRRRSRERRGTFSCRNRRTPSRIRCCSRTQGRTSSFRIPCQRHGTRSARN